MSNNEVTQEKRLYALQRGKSMEVLLPEDSTIEQFLKSVFAVNPSLLAEVGKRYILEQIDARRWLVTYREVINVVEKPAEIDVVKV